MNAHMCSSCVAGLRDSHFHEEKLTDFAIGEVFSIEESVYTPIEHIFSDPNVSGLRGVCLNHSATSLNNLRTRVQATTKTPRPCILSQISLKTRLEDLINPLIYLMATFEGAPMHTLPPIYQFFCIAVHPTLPLCPAQTPPTIPLYDPEIHVHSLPEWPSSVSSSGQCSQWIIAWQFRTTRPLLGRWLTPEARKQARMSSERMSLDRDSNSEDVEMEGARRGMAFGMKACELLEAQTEERRQKCGSKCVGLTSISLSPGRRNLWNGATRGVNGSRLCSVPRIAPPHRKRDTARLYHCESAIVS
ncbi:hypothetical protein C8Q73DRAFT_707022 [Cubamyces lactineus]|nr:hypothetical protein C8Q73DRAFT_707022 [Cubamyces lactineus]